MAKAKKFKFNILIWKIENNVAVYMRLRVNSQLFKLIFKIRLADIIKGVSKAVRGHATSNSTCIDGIVLFQCTANCCF